jgi:AcrR family transcriptional regulator
VLAAADALFADSGELQAVSMDDIAAAAGVGKGTVFRAFGSRDGLLDALFTARMAALREAFEDGPPPLGPSAPPRERLLALLDALLAFKLDNRQLIAARETARAALPRAGHYRWTHSRLRDLISQAASTPAVNPGYAAHALLNVLRPDVIEELLAAGETPESIGSAQAALARRILGLRPWLGEANRSTGHRRATTAAMAAFAASSGRPAGIRATAWPNPRSESAYLILPMLAPSATISSMRSWSPAA